MNPGGSEANTIDALNIFGDNLPKVIINIEFDIESFIFPKHLANDLGFQDFEDVSIIFLQMGKYLLMLFHFFYLQTKPDFPKL